MRRKIYGFVKTEDTEQTRAYLLEVKQRFERYDKKSYLGECNLDYVYEGDKMLCCVSVTEPPFKPSTIGILITLFSLTISFIFGGGLGAFLWSLLPLSLGLLDFFLSATFVQYALMYGLKKKAKAKSVSISSAEYFEAVVW